jgi:hypothetical protein
MSEIKEAIATLKARWPDVVLITGLGVLSGFVNRLSLCVGEKDPVLQTMNLLSALVGLVVIPLLTVGFQRAVYLQGGKRQSPVRLLGIGKPFFWRAIRFELFYVPVSFVLASIVFSIVKRAIGIDVGFWRVAKTDPLVYYSCFAVSMLIMIKLSLLSVPIMIVRDCRVLTSFRLLKQYRLSDSRGLVLLFFAATVLSVLWAFLPSPKSDMTILQNILKILLSITHGLVGLTTAVMAIRFVGSLDPVYDRDSGLLYPGALSD